MANAAVRADLNEALNAAIDFAAQIAFDAKIGFDDLAQTRRIGFAQFADARCRVDARHL